MVPFRSILVAADFSESSLSAFRVACSLSHESKTRLRVVYVLEPQYEVEGPVYSGQQSIQFEPCERDTRDHEAFLRGLRDSYVPVRAIDTVYRTAEGLPSEAILREAERFGADLVVMGTHGRTGLRRLLAGSVAETVLRQAHCPVLAVREPEASYKAGGEEVILHPTDFSEGSDAALSTARALAQDRGARLVLVHVLPLEGVIGGNIPIHLDDRGIRESLAAMGRKLDGPDLKYRVETRLAHGDPASEIARAAGDEDGVPLVVMGTHGRGGLGRMLFGSVAEAVLRHAPCPVLAVKAPRRETVAHAASEIQSVVL